MESLSMSEDAQGHFKLKSMIFQFVTPHILRTAVLLNIPSAIAKAGRPLSLSEILASLPKGKNPQADVLQRILHFLVHKEVFDEVVGDDGQVYYGINSVSKWLAEEHHLLLLCMHEYAQDGFQKIDEAILNGGYAYALANKSHCWETGKYDPEYNKVINEAMVAWSSVTMGLVVDNYDGFDGVKKLVDVGGGLGACCEKIVKKYPHIQCVNFDLPHCIAIAPAIPGVEHVPGNMFESVPSGDAILVKSVLINFNDEDCLKLLSNCYKALPPGGKVIVVELIHTREGPFEFDLDMIMIGFTDGGKSRAFEEHKGLLEKCGFTNITVKNMASKEQVIEGFKN